MDRLYELTEEIINRNNIEEIYITWKWVKTGNNNFRMNKEFVKLWNSGSVFDWIEYEKYYRPIFEKIIYT